MRKLPFLLCIVTCACEKKVATEKDPYPVKYENELFSVSLPEDWRYDSSGWNGLDSMENEVYFYKDEYPQHLWFRFVKTYFPIQWKSAKEAADMPKYMSSLRKDEDITIVNELDSLTVGGYPAYLITYLNEVEGDTIVQMQYVTYMQDSHITMYFNANMPLRYYEKYYAQSTEIIDNIKLKKVENPLENR